MLKKSLVLFAGVSLFCGCGTSATVIDETSNRDRVQSIDDITPKDWADAAAAGTESLLKSNVLVRFKAENDGEKPRVMVSTVKNSTSQHVNTGYLTERITEDILNSGQASLSSAVGVGSAVDTASKQLRNLEDDDDFDQSTVLKRGTLVSPNVSLSGEIMEQKVKDGREYETSFLFAMKLTNAKTGEVLWKYNKEIAKRKTKSIFGF